MIFSWYVYTDRVAMQGAWGMKGFRVSGARALLVFFLGFATTAVSAQMIALPAQQHPGQQGLYKAAQMSRAGTRLARAHAEYRYHLSQGRPTAFVPSDRLLPFSNGRILVEARAAADGAALLDDLQALGLANGSRYGLLVSGLIPLAAIEQAVQLASLRSISAALPPIRNAGSITSEGDVALRADLARSTYGVDGSGVTVGVLSDSFDTLGGASTDVGTGDLPSAGVTVIGGESTYCGTIIFCIDEGRAMLQIIHDLAPGAELLFHTGLASKTDYANGITALAAAGADVIVDDLLYLNEPMFQDGIVAQAVDSVFAAGAVYYSAAGNAGHESYEAAFNNSGVYLCIEFYEPPGDCHPILERVGLMHDFDPSAGVDLSHTVIVPLDGVLTVAMQWDEPFGGPGARNDHDVVLLDEDGGIYYTLAANDNVATGEGWEVLQFQNSAFLTNTTRFSLAITYDDIDSIGPPANLIKLVVFGSGNSLDEWPAEEATLFGHANAAGAEAVGAAFWDDTPEFSSATPILEPYSSRGGTPILYNSNGSPKGTPEMRLKPEIVGVDGVETTFFFSDTDGDTRDEFYGTSAAAPHAAGIAALMLDWNSNVTPAQINAALESTAIDMNAPGFDHDSGYGLVRADFAIGALPAPGGNNPPTADFSFEATALDVDFTDTSSDSDGTIMSWSWDFGDGNSSNAQHPSHSYAAGGTYDVRLTVTDDENAADSVSQQVTVSAGDGNAPPVANFAYSCSGRDCQFSSTATFDAAPATYSWDFGDGSESTLENPSHTYPNRGTYVVTFTVTDAESAQDSVTLDVRVKNGGSTSGATGGGDSGGDTGDTIEAEKGRKKCNDGIDNDGDGLTDGADPDCS